MIGIQNKRTKIGTITMFLGTVLLFSLLFPTNLEGTVLLQEQEWGEETPHSRSSDAHPTITIDGNAELAAFCTVGSGTEVDPYIIENLEIDATSAHGIAIQSTDAYLIIRNCTVIYGESIKIYNGIDLSYCENIIISNNELRGVYHGIYLNSSSYNAITDNNSSTNRNGIFLDGYSNYNTITSNNCSTNDYYGIYFKSSSNNIITGNNCSTNYYDAIFLHSSSYNTISGNNCSANFYGILLFSSSNNNTITSNNCFDMYMGIDLKSLCNYNIISGNNCSANFYGIYLESSNSSTITDNNCSDNTYGIYLESSNDNSITSNNCSDNTYGIYLKSSSDNIISENIGSIQDYVTDKILTYIPYPIAILVGIVLFIGFRKYRKARYSQGSSS